MKVRSGFVSNSSSSSFIIAIDSRVGSVEIDKFVEHCFEYITRFVAEGGYVEARAEKIAEEIKQELKNEIVWELNSGTGLALEDWIIFAQEYSNEDDIFSSFMYECAELLNTDLFKFKCGEYQYENS